MSIYAPALIILWRHMEAFGLDPESLFAAEGIGREMLSDERRRLSFAVVDRLRAQAAAVSGRPEFGLAAARYWHPSSMGALGYAWLLSPSLEAAFHTCARYIRMLNEQLGMEVDKTAESVIVRFEFHGGSADPVVREDSALALLSGMCRANLGVDTHPQQVDFQHAEPELAAPYYDLFKCPLNFSSAATAIHYEREQAEKVCQHASPQLREMNIQVIEEYLQGLNGESFSDKVRSEIMRQLPSGKISDGSLAGAFHISSRTLQRRLKAENTSYQTLLTEVRVHLARRYMRDRDLSLTEISFLLGFAETSSFSRAYKRWTGESPSAGLSRG